MHTYRVPDLWPRSGDRPCPPQFLQVVRSQDNEGLGHSPLPCARDDGLEVFSELRARQVTVRINHDRQRTRAPGATPSTLTSVGGPPSTLAASTMPFDSTPISFAGLRLNTMTTLRPTRSSG